MLQHDFFAGPNARLLATGRLSPRPHDGRFGNALSVSAVAHAICGLCLLIVASRLTSSHEAATKFFRDVPRLAWIADSGSGGTGNNDAHPSQPLQRPGHDAVTIPANARTDSRTVQESTLPQSFDVPVVSATAGIEELPGVMTGLGVTPGGGPGTHPGPGAGSGNGPGLGPGHIGGLGDGYLPGNGVSTPRLIREVKPSYTGEAMRARIQGTVRLQAIVLPDGSVGNARVVRSLDGTFGLDDEALKAIKQWRFEPGRREGRAVPIVIEVELTFTLR